MAAQVSIYGSQVVERTLLISGLHRSKMHRLLASYPDQSSCATYSFTLPPPRSPVCSASAVVHTTTSRRSYTVRFTLTHEALSLEDLWQAAISLLAVGILGHPALSGVRPTRMIEPVTRCTIARTPCSTLPKPLSSPATGGCQMDSKSLQHLRLPRLKVWKFICAGAMHPCMTQLNITARHRIYTRERQLEILYNVLDSDLFPRSSNGLEHITVPFEAWTMAGDDDEAMYDLEEDFGDYWQPARYGDGAAGGQSIKLAEGMEEYGSVSRAHAAYTLKRYTVICTRSQTSGMFGYRYSILRPRVARYFQQALLNLLQHMPRNIQVEVVGAEWFSSELRADERAEADNWSFENDMRKLLKGPGAVEVAYEGKGSERTDTRNERLVFTRLIDYLGTAAARDVFEEEVKDWQAWLSDPKLEAPPKLTRKQLCCPKGYCEGEEDGEGCRADFVTQALDF